MEIIACQCDGLPPHTHTSKIYLVRTAGGRTARVPEEIFKLNMTFDWEIIGEEPEGIRLWVDWKAVARALMVGDQ